MIPREKWVLFTTCILLLIVEVKLQSGRAYDNSEWIPVTQSALKATTSNSVEQTASDRVLNLDAPAQKFFPDEEYEYRKRRPNQVQQFLRESPPTQKGIEHPRPRKLKHPSEYKFETPPPPPSKKQPEINYYNGENMSPFLFEQPLPPRASKPIIQQAQQSYSVPVQQLPNQRPLVNSYVAVPNINPQAPAANSPNVYDQYQLPFNTSFYQSLNPASLNNDFYQAISNSQNVQQKLQSNIPQPNLPILNKPTVSPKPAIDQETVQLVYVPVENLKTSQPNYQNTKNIYQQLNVPKQEPVPSQASQVSNFESVNQPRHEALVYTPPYLQQRPDLIYPEVNQQSPKQETSSQDSSENKQLRLENIQQDFIHQALQAQRLQKQLQDDINPLKQETFTATPKVNRKPHQPPLAVFLESQKKAEISDVLNILKNARSISVQDTVTSASPNIFVGPSNLDSPEGYTKFPLPYLNNINGNRIERKIDQLPFFVAPVSYRTPPGYAKIPLPSPHVGSVVVSVPGATSTTPDPILLQHNQLNPFTYSTAGYSPLDPPTSSRPVQNYLNNYETSGQGRIRYQNTAAPQATESPLIPPVRDFFDSQYASPQPDIYYTQQNTQQTYKDDIPTLNIFKPQQQENNKYTSSQEYTRQTSSTARPKETSYEATQLPNVNPLELAINEFELHQINNEFEQPNKKVKHSTTRRPPSRGEYEETQTISSTRSPVSRGRQTYDLEPTTEKTSSRTRVRGRGRGSSSRTAATTTSTTPLPVENNNRYTVLEEFQAREPTRNPSTENYGRFSAEVQTDAPRRSTTVSNRNVYLVDQSSDTRRPQPNNEYSRSQTSLGESFDSRRPSPTSDDSRSQQPLDEGYVKSISQVELTDINQQPVIDNSPQTAIDSIQSQNRALEGTKSVTVDVKNIQDVQPLNTYLQKDVEIENIPASVYSLGEPQTYDSTAFDFDSSKNTQDSKRLYYENINTDSLDTRRVQEQSRPTPSHRFSPEVISYENREPNQQLRPQKKPKYQEYDIDVNNEPVVKQAFQPEVHQQPSSEIPDQALLEQNSKQQPINDPTGFLENLYQPNFDQTYLSLQDQAVRSLLVPNLLAPSAKQQVPSVTGSDRIISSTEAIVEIPSSTEAETSTTTRPTRARGRGRARPATTSATATSAPRRTAGRRRPVSRTSTERITSSTEYAPREDSERSGSNAKQNFRTRGRPIQNEITDRMSTTENHLRTINEPLVEGFETLKSREPPQSYMQFEHAIDEQQIITINPNRNEESDIKEYHQLYSSPQQVTTEREQYLVEYENTRLRPTPVVDVQVTHEVPEDTQRNLNVITKPTEVEQYVRYNNANIRSGGIINNNKPATTTHVPTTKARGRTRGRSRIATPAKTTLRPVTRISTTSPLRTSTQVVEEEENYGFIRQPAYHQRNIQAQTIQVQTSPRNEEPVHFVGEIRPKYSSHKTTLSSTEELESTEASKPRIRARTRAPTRKPTNTYRNSENDDNNVKSAEQATRRTSNTRGRVRGSSHYKPQEYQKRESDDEDVANQNYPVNFLQKLDVSSTPASTAFKITIDPLDEDTDDQSPHSSIHRPRYAAMPDGWSNFNALPFEDKPVSVKPEEITSAEPSEVIFSTEESQALSLVQTTENSDELFTKFTDTEVGDVIRNMEKIDTSPTEEILTTLEPTEVPLTTRKVSRRRGAWKLVKHRPLDPLEVSESQNYQSVLNVFDSIEKADLHTKSKPSYDTFTGTGTGKDSYDKDILNFNDFRQEISSIDNSYSENKSLEGTKDVEEVVTIVSDDSASTEAQHVTEGKVDDLSTTTPSTTKTQENIFNTIYEMFGIFNKPENKKNDTSLDVSKGLDREETPTTILNPVFPEEITEASSTEKVSEKNENKEETRDDIIESTEGSLGAKPVTKPYEVEPWKMRAVKTSTSTEVSHETEICYKGRCIKSKEKKKEKF